MNGYKNEVMSFKTIDRRSFILGMITAFAECVATECKRAALSPPFYPEDHESVLPEAETIAKEQGIFLWYEENLDIPENVRLNWFVLYKFPEAFEEYQNLRKQGYNPALNFKEFSGFLSYGTIWGDAAENVIPRLRERRQKMETFARVLLKPGDWPIQKV